MTEQDELQAAADRGELAKVRAKTNQQFLAAVAATERRWIILQAVEVAKAQRITPQEFRELCRFILEFTASPSPDAPRDVAAPAAPEIPR